MSHWKINVFQCWFLSIVSTSYTGLVSTYNAEPNTKLTLSWKDRSLEDAIQFLEVAPYTQCICLQMWKGKFAVW